jgi:hypothetical protein
MVSANRQVLGQCVESAVFYPAVLGTFAALLLLASAVYARRAAAAKAFSLSPPNPPNPFLRNNIRAA